MWNLNCFHGFLMFFLKQKWRAAKFHAESISYHAEINFLDLFREHRGFLLFDPFGPKEEKGIAVRREKGKPPGPKREKGKRAPRIFHPVLTRHSHRASHARHETKRFPGWGTWRSHPPQPPTINTITNHVIIM